MNTSVEASDWTALDPWWSAYAGTRSFAQDPDLTVVFSPQRVNRCWEELDPWWSVFTETGDERVGEILDLLKQSNEQWSNSPSSFDTDPLAANLTETGHVRGPIHPKVEMEWSRWLAQLIRPSAALVSELFDVVEDQAPSEVVLEKQLEKQEGSFRRPDILLFHPDRGVSIEVKLDDVNYQKTPKTAKLVERHYEDREWDHVLLLPNRKEGSLDSLIDAPLRTQDGEQSCIEWDDPGPIKVIFWRDVVAAIRALLHRDEVVDDHWAANAYLFCAVAELQIMNFQPQPVIERLAQPTNVVDALQPIGIVDILAEQSTYLRERVDP
jgi:hypothetical protein